MNPVGSKEEREGMKRAAFADARALAARQDRCQHKSSAKQDLTESGLFLATRKC